MGVHLSLVNFDQAFRFHSGRTPTILNDVPAFSEDDRQKLSQLIMMTYSSDLLSNVPSCECRKISGKYNLGVTCVSCGTEVKEILGEDLQPLTWIRAPKGVKKLINPIVWTMLKRRFNVDKFNVVKWLCDTTYHPEPGVTPEVLALVREIRINGQPIKQGYNYFVENFDAIIYELLQLKTFRTKRGRTDALWKLLQDQRECVFSDHLPIPHRTLMVRETNDTGNYVDPITTGGLDALHMIAGMDTEYNTSPVYVRENRTVKTIDQLSIFYENTYRVTLASKEGIYRKHVFATRSHFSFRAVVSSITDHHDYDEIHIPWGVATSVFRIHLMNKLLRIGYTPNEVIAFIDEHAQKHHPLLEQLFNEIITEAPNGKGVAATINRNPSLQRGSMQLVYITKVKTDVMVPTVSLSILIINAMNCDFDGDALQFTVLIDQIIEQGMQPLAPHMSAFGLRNPREVADIMSMPKPVVSTISNWMEAPLDPPDPIKVEIMQRQLAA